MTAAPQPIELVTFDLYDTLIEIVPSRWDRLGFALEKLGEPVHLHALRDADVVAEDFYTERNTIKPIRDLGHDDQEAFRVEYMRRWLEAAGYQVSDDLAKAARAGYRSELDAVNWYTNYRVYADVVETMQRLRDAGVKRAIISNADADVTDFVTHLAVADEFDLIVTSAVVGWEKPDVRTFQAAFVPLEVAPERSLHIGDQPRSDVVGSLASGMRAALIDRYARHDQANHEVPVMRTFGELVDYVIANNEQAAG
ncbi:MAG: HAD-IA family hydrolase [Thermomicrobiales bacterium]